MSDKLSKIEPTERPTQEAGPDETPKVGEWYWVKDEDRWLGCVVHVGSNYAKLQGVIESAPDHWRKGEPWEGSKRIHLDHFRDVCTSEANPDSYLSGRIVHHQQQARALMGEVQRLTALLGVGKRDALPSGNEVQALVVASSSQPIEDYKKALIKAQEETLPDLFKKIASENKALSLWMTAPMIPMEAEARSLNENIDRIKDRVFTVELYAGLTEQVEQVADGEPAPEMTPIHLLQRRHYMDEECLLAYEAGGMNFEDIHEFDKWLARPANRDRILPFPRCMVAFRVRRNRKDYGTAISLSRFIEIKTKEDADKWTFLYLRNGERMYRLGTGIEFEPKLFPDLDKQQMTQRLFAKMFTSSHIERLVTEGEYEEMKRERAEAQARLKTLPQIKHPGVWNVDRMRKKYQDDTEYDARFAEWQAKRDVADERQSERHRLKYKHDDLDRYHPFEPNNIHYDDIAKYIAVQMAQHNRVVMVLQGLLDRSPVFHPHPPWQIYTQAGFEQGLKLVFDEDRALVAGEPPDFEAYRNTLNGSLQEGSVVIGQERAWMLHEGQKEIARRNASWRYKSEERYHYQDYLSKEGHRPDGNPGPGLVARVAGWSTARRVATFKWNRERLRHGRSYFNRGKIGEPLATSFSCSGDELLNLDAYEPGDFKIFFADPRTRADYLKWAPLLLRAEDYKAGKVKVREPEE